MSDELRIMVRTEEVRKVSLEERCIICIAECRNSNHPGVSCIADPSLVKDAQKAAKQMGYVQSTLGWDADARKWVAKFRTLREAYVDEIDAWHLIRLSSRSPLHQFPYHGKGVNPFHLLKHNRQAVLDAQALLRDKEVVLEVVKGGDV